MTFAEFSIRSYAYRREEQFLWAKFRHVAYHSLISFNTDAKRLPKSEQKLLPLEMVDRLKSNQVSKEVAERFKEAVRQINVKKNL